MRPTPSPTATGEAGTRTQDHAKTLTRIESAYHWRPGSIEAVLAGGEPDPMTVDDMRSRALAASSRLALAERL